MRTLSRYFVGRFLGFFATTLLASTLAIVIVETLLNFDDMLKVQEGAQGVATYLLLRIPSYYLPDLIPISAFAGAFFALGLASRRLEITAMKAGGLPPRSAIVPILAAAALLGAATLFVNETLVIRSAQSWQTNVSGDARHLDYRRGSFWYQRGRTLYNVRGADRSTRTLHGVSLFERDQGGHLVRSIHAERVRIGDDHQWHLENAIIRRFDPESRDSAPQVERLESTVLEMASDMDAALMDADASLLSTVQLRTQIQLRMAEGDRVHHLEALLHSRLADPVTVWLLTFLAVPFALRVEESRSLGQPALLGIVTVAAFFAARSLGDTLAAEGVVPAIAGAWSTLLFFGALGTWQLARVPR